MFVRGSDQIDRLAAQLTNEVDPSVIADCVYEVLDQFIDTFASGFQMHIDDVTITHSVMTGKTRVELTNGQIFVITVTEERA